MILYPEHKEDEEDSDSEDEEHHRADRTDGKDEPVFGDEGMEGPKEGDEHDPGLLSRIAQSFLNKFPVLQTRSGRAGRVHNFLRGLQLMVSSVPAGESWLFVYRAVSDHEGNRVPVQQDFLYMSVKNNN